jgi:predicted MPP superfamily phosphohydrolase
VSSRPKTRPAFIFAAVLFGVTGLLWSGWAFLVEPQWLEVTHHRIVVPREAGLVAPVVIAHVTDLHTDGLGRLERKLIDALRVNSPDLIVLTGDTATPGGTVAGYEAVWKALAGVGAPLGVLSIRGEREVWAPTPNERKLAAAVGVTFLINESIAVREDLWVVGLDDTLGNYDRVTAAHGVPEHVFALGLLHAPHVAWGFSHDTDMILSGHTHGGQFVWPILGHPYTPPGSKHYVSGCFSASS